MTDTPPKSAKVQSDTLISKLLKGKEVHELFATSLRNQLTISGQPIPAWEKKFKLTIPTDNLTPAMCKALDMKLMDLHQEASFYYAAASAKAQVIRRGGESNYHEKFYALVQEYKDKGGKVPAAATLETLAKIDNDEVDSAIAIADIETKFWKDVLEHLSTCRKLIENATINISVEMKAEQNASFLDRMNQQK